VADLDRIRSAGKHLLSLIDDILDLSKIEAGRMTLFLENVDVTALVKELTTTVRPLMERNHNHFLVEMDPAIPLIRSDMKMLRQTLSNLLDNASKFTRDGTVRLSIAQDPDDLAFVRIQVQDTGIGMTPEQQVRVFQEFSQADESTTRRFGGTGLGLALCRRFVTLLGGEILLSSTPGQGSTFQIRLPKMGERPQTLIGETAQESAQDEGVTKVLIIDDDAAMRDALSRMLTREGYWVAAASSGQEGLNLAHALKPHIITLDIAMPGMDGWEVLETLKHDVDLRNTPVVLVTMMEGRSKGYALGAADFIQKPISRDSLLPVLKRLTHFKDDSPVLIVEDDPDTLKGLCRILDPEGWPIQTATNGSDAMDQITFQRPRVILLDLMLPGMDGFQLLTELQHHPEWSAIPVVVLTAKDLTREDLERLHAPQVRQVFSKGAIGKAEIVEAVRNLARRFTPPIPPPDLKG